MKHGNFQSGADAGEPGWLPARTGHPPRGHSVAGRGPAWASRVALLAATALLVQSCSHATGNPLAEPPPANASSDPAPARGENPAGQALSFEEAMAREEPSRKEPGLPIGQRAPAFTLEDQSGSEVSLESLLAKGPVALVFNRSADWCLYCKMQSVQLQQNLEEIQATGGHVVGISYDPVETLKRFADRSGITFPLLSDVGSKTIDAYGIRNTNEPARDGIAYHGTFIVDQNGVIRSKLFQVSYAERPAVDTLVRALKEARSTSEGTNP